MSDPEIDRRYVKEYWEWRVKNHADEKRMIWYGNEWKWDAMEMITKNVLNTFGNCSVLEVACGYGRHAELFDKDKYLGFDFSEEMIKLAKEKHPDYHFEVQDANLFKPDKKYDIVFGVMAMGLVHKLSDYANIAVIELSPSETTIKFKDLT